MAPGKSICPEKLSHKEDDNLSPMPGTSGMNMKNNLGKRNTVKTIFPKRKDNDNDGSDMDIDLNEAVMEFERERLDENNFEELLENERDLDKCFALEKCERKVGEFVVFKYEGELFPGKIVKFNVSEVNDHVHAKIS